MTIQGRQSMECCRMWNWRTKKGRIEDIACCEGRPATCTACEAVMRGGTVVTITFDCQQLQGSINDILSHVQGHLDVNRLIIDLRTLLFSSVEELIVAVLENLFENPSFLGTVKMSRAGRGDHPRRALNSSTISPTARIRSTSPVTEISSEMPRTSRGAKRSIARRAHSTSVSSG